MKAFALKIRIKNDVYDLFITPLCRENFKVEIDVWCPEMRLLDDRFFVEESNDNSEEEVISQLKERFRQKGIIYSSLTL